MLLKIRHNSINLTIEKIYTDIINEYYNEEFAQRFAIAKFCEFLVALLTSKASSGDPTKAKHQMVKEI